MAKESKSSNGGIGFLGLLTILFIGLKLTGHIEWSWIWVLSPLWMPIAFILGLVALIGIGLLIFAIAEMILEKRRK